jgi:Condensation domain
LVDGIRVRTLGSLEWLMWILRMNLVIEVELDDEIDGEIRDAQLRDALAAIQRKHPLLRVKVTAGPGGVLSFVETAEPAPVTYARLASWAEVAEREVNRPFTLDEGPLLRVVADLDGPSARLLFTTSHAVTDGRSLSFLVRDLLDALNGRTLEPRPTPAPLDAHLLAGKSSLQAWREFFRFSVRMKRAMKQSGVRVLPGLLRPDLAARRFETGFLLREVPADVAQPLPDCARAENSSVHSVLCAAQLMAIAEVFGDGRDPFPLSYVSPADLQPRIASGIEDDQVLFISGGDGIQIMHRGDTLWNVARRIKEQLHSSLLDSASLLGSLMSVRAVAGMKRWLTADERGFRRMMRLVTASSPLATAVSSKMRPRWESAAGPHRVRSFWLLPASPTAPMVSFAAAGNGLIRWTFAFQRDLMTAETAGRVADAAARILSEAVRGRG